MGITKIQNNKHKKLTKNDRNFTNMLQNLEICVKGLYNINIGCYNEIDKNLLSKCNGMFIF